MHLHGDERTCRFPGCGRAAVARYGHCLEHVFSPAVRERERATRAELDRIADEARVKQALGEQLTPREAEVVESFRILNARFGGHYPAPAPRPGVVCLDRDGAIVDPREVSAGFRVKKDEKMQRIFLTGTIEAV